MFNLYVLLPFLVILEALFSIVEYSRHSPVGLWHVFPYSVSFHIKFIIVSLKFDGNGKLLVVKNKD